MPARGLVDHGHIVCCCLVVLHPAAIDKVKLPLCHKALHQIFGLVGLLPPPAREEGLQRKEGVRAGHQATRHIAPILLLLQPISFG